jgi:subtilisin family serine protease
VRRALALAASAAALAAPAAAAAAATPPNDPLAQRQWYLARDRALDVFDAAKQLFSVRVAVIDSGIDLGHPELRGRIVASRSFVGGSVADELGHGTFVAGEIAAIADNNTGIAGLAPPARLVVAKVVASDGTIAPRTEARAIRWAVRSGARVINLSFGSTRDPGDVHRDGFSGAERRAIEFAVRRGVLVVAAVGNGDDAPTKPWPYASYPAAFPHVLAVAAYGRSGGVPSFSNRDEQYVDLAAPGMDIFSLFPRLLTQSLFPSCPEQGYSICGTKEYRHADGTSFSSPQVAAAAALLLGEIPSLRPDQVSAILESAAADATPASGCNDCTIGRDALTGAGRLDIGEALDALTLALPPADRLEPNDDVRGRAAIVNRTLNVRATLDSWDDPTDVYRVYLHRGQGISVLVRGSPTIDPSLVLWKPGLESLARTRSDLRARRSIHGPGVPERIAYRSHRSGWYYVQVRLARPAFGTYRIKLAS